MAKREVQAGIGMITYTDPAGERRIGQAGEQVNVDPSDMARFDRVNGTAPENKPRKAAAPQKRAAPRRK